MLTRAGAWEDPLVVDGSAPVVLGVVVRVQVQRSPLKPGPRGARVYDPAPLLQVPRARITPRGVVGLTPQGPVVDAHHADHAQSRNKRLANGLSVLPVAHYDAMRADFGDHVGDGCAGENLLLRTSGRWDGQELAGTLGLETEEGPVLVLELVQAAAPCVEFTRWALRRGVGPVDEDVRAAMDLLGAGRRGFYLRPHGSGTVAPGARLLTRRAPAQPPQQHGRAQQ